MMLKQTKLVGAVILAGVFALSNANADNHLNVTGFADGQFQWNNQPSYNGFVINDGALYVNAKSGIAEFMLDLPFASVAGSGAFTVTTAKAQAYFKVNYDNGLYWQLGQFDTLYGFELNDTKDIFFTNPGIVFNGLLPTTHTGLLVGWATKMGLEIKFMVGNVNNSGNAAGDNLKFGTQFLYSKGMWRLGAGYDFGDTGGTGFSGLIDVLAGISLGALDIDVEFDYNHVDTGTNGWGLLAHIVYDWNQTWSTGVAFEYVKDVAFAYTNIAAAAGDHILVRVGPNVNVTKHLVFKLDYALGSIASGNTTTHSVAFGGVYEFN